MLSLTRSRTGPPRGRQHGDHLPLSTDTIIARRIADTYPVLLPPITISCSHEHSAWPGTVSISARTLHAVITDVCDSVTRTGPRALVVVNAHGGNYVLSNVVQEAGAQGRSVSQVYQGGPRNLWDEVEAAHGWWVDRGRPGHEEFGLTVTADGQQRVWLGDPSNLVSRMTAGPGGTR